MRSLGVRLPIFALTAWAGIALSVSGMNYSYGQTVYLTPTVATFGLPTSYVATSYYAVPTSYSYSSYIPTSYSYSSYIPTSYAYETALVAPTSYVTTGYTVRRGLFGRLRLVERPVIASYATSYVPTTYFAPAYETTAYRSTSYLPTVYSPRIYRPTVYAPTVYDTVYAPTVYRPTVYAPTTYDYSPTVWESSYVSSSGLDCDQVAWNTPATVVPSQSYSSSSQSYPARSSGGRSKAVQSESAADQGFSSGGRLQPAEEPPLSSSVQETPKAAAERADSPPAVPSATRQQNTAQPSPTGQGGATATPKAGANPPASPKPIPPAAPSGDPTEPDLRPAPIDNNATNRRESLRPAYASRPTRPEQLRNVLMGRVETEAGEPLGEVPVSATNRDNNAIRRAGMTDAFGNFAIRLNDGEWTVNVRTPSGRVYPVRSVTVSNGKVMDNREGREVRNLIISY